MRKAIAIDFDGCLFTDAFPDIGEPIWPVIEKAKKEQQNGAGLILWTCREGDLLEKAVRACQSCGLEFDAINESLPDWIEEFENRPRKVGASEYWDDKSINTRPWFNMERDGPPECDKKFGVSQVCFICDAFGRTGYGIYQDGTKQLMHPGWFTGGNAGEGSARIDYWMYLPIPPIERRGIDGKPEADDGE